MMSVLWKKIEFYREESNREAIVIAAWGFFWRGGMLQGSLTRQVFPLRGHFPPAKFFPLIKVLVSPIVT